MSDTKQIARELLRRRVLTQQKGGDNDLMNAMSQATLLSEYRRLPTVHDLQFNRNYLDFVTADEDDRTVRVVAVKGDWDHRVWSNMLDVDTIVFARYDERQEVATLEGWMPRLEVEESPMEWWEIDGKRVSYFHTVDRAAFIDMPSSFSFSDSCVLHDPPAGFWDVRLRGWRCVACDRILYDMNATDRLEALYGYESKASGTRGSNTPSKAA